MSPWGCWKELVSSWLLVGLICKDPLSLQIVASAIKSYLVSKVSDLSSEACKPSSECRILYKIMNVTEITSSFLSWECLHSYVFIWLVYKYSYCARNWAANTELLTWREKVIVYGNSCVALFRISSIKTTPVTFLYDLWDTIQIQVILTTKGRMLRPKV